MTPANQQAEKDAATRAAYRIVAEREDACQCAGCQRDIARSIIEQEWHRARIEAERLAAERTAA